MYVSAPCNQESRTRRQETYPAGGLATSIPEMVVTAVTLATTHVVAANAESRPFPAVEALGLHRQDEVRPRVCAVTVIANPVGVAVVVVAAGMGSRASG